jgi:hypothetical protein
VHGALVHTVDSTAGLDNAEADRRQARDRQDATALGRQLAQQWRRSRQRRVGVGCQTTSGSATADGKGACYMAKARGSGVVACPPRGDRVLHLLIEGTVSPGARHASADPLATKAAARRQVTFARRPLRREHLGVQEAGVQGLGSWGRVRAAAPAVTLLAVAVGTAWWPAFAAAAPPHRGGWRLERRVRHIGGRAPRGGEELAECA